MNRELRRSVVVAAATLPWWLPHALAQQKAMPRIGFLGVSTPAAWTTRIEALREGFGKLGYVEGRNIAFEFRFAGGQYDRLPELADELLRAKVDVIVTHAAPGALAAKRATAANRVPVVMTNVADAVGAGIVTNLAHPGGNITGDTFFVPELAAKRIAKDLGVKPEEVVEMETRLGGHDLALDPTPGDEETFVSPIAYLTDHEDEPAQILEREESAQNRSKGLQTALAKLDDRSRRIIEARWLREDDSAATLQDLANEYGVSAERIRQIEVKALQKMRGALAEAA